MSSSQAAAGGNEHIKIKWQVAMRDEVVPASTVRLLEIQANRTARKRPARAEKASAPTNRQPPEDSSEERRPVRFDRGHAGMTVHYLTQSELRASFNGGDPNGSDKVSLWEETHKVQAETNKQQAAKIQQLEKQLEEAKKSYKRKLSALEIKMRTERWTAAATHIERLEGQVKAAQEAERSLKLQQAARSSHADIVLLNEKVEELKQQLQTANTSYNQLLSASESVAKERNSAKSRIEALELENQRLLASESECKKKLEAAEGAKEQALVDNSSLKSGLVQAKSLASKCKARVEGDRDSQGRQYVCRGQLTNANNGLQGKLDASKEDAAEKATQIERLAADNVELAKQNDTTSDQLESTLEEKSALQESVVELEKQLHDQTEGRREAQERIVTLKGEADEEKASLKAAIEALSQTEKEQRKELVESNQLIENLKSGEAGYQQQLEVAKKQYTELGAGISQRNEQIEGLKKQIETTNAANERLAKERDTAQSEIEALQLEKENWMKVGLREEELSTKDDVATELVPGKPAASPKASENVGHNANKSSGPLDRVLAGELRLLNEETDSTVAVEEGRESEENGSAKEDKTEIEETAQVLDETGGDEKPEGQPGLNESTASQKNLDAIDATALSTGVNQDNAASGEKLTVAAKLAGVGKEELQRALLPPPGSQIASVAPTVAAGDWVKVLYEEPDMLAMPERIGGHLGKVNEVKPASDYPSNFQISVRFDDGTDTFPWPCEEVKKVVDLSSFYPAEFLAGDVVDALFQNGSQSGRWFRGRIVEVREGRCDILYFDKEYESDIPTNEDKVCLICRDASSDEQSWVIGKEALVKRRGVDSSIDGTGVVSKDPSSDHYVITISNGKGSPIKVNYEEAASAVLSSFKLKKVPLTSQHAWPVSSTIANTKTDRQVASPTSDGVGVAQNAGKAGQGERRSHEQRQIKQITGEGAAQKRERKPFAERPKQEERRKRKSTDLSSCGSPQATKAKSRKSVQANANGKKASPKPEFGEVGWRFKKWFPASKGWQAGWYEGKVTEVWVSTRNGNRTTYRKCRYTDGTEEDYNLQSMKAEMKRGHLKAL
ncbi:hypothetical protein ACHAXT_011208 [Thalassiosira profunda]